MLLKSQVYSQTRMTQWVWRRQGDSDSGFSPVWIKASRHAARWIERFFDPPTCLPRHRLFSLSSRSPLLSLVVVALATACDVRRHLLSHLLTLALTALFLSVYCLSCSLFIFSGMLCSTLPCFIMVSSSQNLLILGISVEGLFVLDIYIYIFIFIKLLLVLCIILMNYEPIFSCLMNWILFFIYHINFSYTTNSYDSSYSLWVTFFLSPFRSYHDPQV